MKRMYVVLAIISLFLFWTFSSMGQKKAPLSESEKIQKRLEMRAEMHRRMIEKLMYGNGPDQDLFKDMEQLFDDTLADSLTGFETEDHSAFFGEDDNFSSEWIESADSKTLVITPKNEGQQLDINVDKDVISIKGKTEIKTQNTSRMSHFQKSFTVPFDCDGSKVKMSQKDGKILVIFPLKKGTKAITTIPETPPKQESRKPLPPSGNEIEI